MAVEARHHVNPFPSHLTTNRNFMKSNQVPINMYNSVQLDTGLPMLNEPIISETLMPFHQSSVWENPTSAIDNKLCLNNNNKADSGLTYNVPPIVASRKRPRNPFGSDLEDYSVSAFEKSKICSGLSSFVDEEVVFQIQQQQSEIDRFIAQHNQKVQIELEERRKRQSRMLVAAIQEGIVKKLIEKDEELQKIGKLNWALQERVKSLYVENQLWRDLAQSNEATAITLRSNLEQVLAHVGEERHISGCGAATTLVEDEESSCGSNYPDRCTLAAVKHEGPEGGVHDKGKGVKDSNCNNRVCRKCGLKESSVLLLPCRHLCLCTLCGSTSVATCPVCDSVMTGSVHVNMS